MPRISFQKTGLFGFSAPGSGGKGCKRAANFQPLLVSSHIFIIIPFINYIGRSEASCIYSL